MLQYEKIRACLSLTRSHLRVPGQITRTCAPSPAGKSLIPYPMARELSSCFFKLFSLMLWHDFCGEACSYPYPVPRPCSHADHDLTLVDLQIAGLRHVPKRSAWILVFVSISQGALRPVACRFTGGMSLALDG